jgi:predicted nucleic acid-binding protein
VQESGSDVMRAALGESEVVACAAIGYAELRAALARAARDGRIAATDRARTRVLVDQLWNGVAEVPVDAALIRHAGDLAEQYGLRGYDAVHLAALLALGGPGEARLACWDEELADVARGLGYDVVGAARL